MLQEGRPLCKQLVAIWTFKHVDLLRHQMSVKMDVEQGFLGKNGPAHHTFIYLPVKKNKKNKNYCLNRKQLDLKHRQRCKEDKRTWTAWLSLRAEGAGCYCECQRWKQI